MFWINTKVNSKEYDQFDCSMTLLIYFREKIGSYVFGYDII